MAADRRGRSGEVSLDGRMEADGLAVGQATEFVAPLMRPLVSGVFTVQTTLSSEALCRDAFLNTLRSIELALQPNTRM